MKPGRYRVDVTQAIEVDAHRTDDALRDAIAREVQREPGRPTVGDAPMTGTERWRRSQGTTNETVDNIHGFVGADAPELQVERPTGNAVNYALLRLGEQRADLSGATLTGANLSRADLTGATLSGANLSGANLRWADLGGANLRGADLTGANLTGANLEDADLSGTIGYEPEG